MILSMLRVTISYIDYPVRSIKNGFRKANNYQTVPQPLPLPRQYFDEDKGFDQTETKIINGDRGILEPKEMSQIQ